MAEYLNALRPLDELEKTIAPETADGFIQAESNTLLIRYDEETRQLFFMYMFNYNELQNEYAPTFQVFYKNITAYKDVESDDYIFFATDAVNLLESGFNKIWKVNKTIELVTAWQEELSQKVKELKGLVEKYYLSHMNNFETEEDGVQYFDEEAFTKAFFANMDMDPSLKKIWKQCL